MRHRGPLTRAFVVIIVGVLVLGTIAAGGQGIVDARTDAGQPQGGDAAALAAAEPTPIASCTAITEPGEYVLTQDLAANGSADACIQIDVIGTVVIDGQGHSVEGGIDAKNDSADETDVTLVLELRNATVDTISYPSGDFTGGGGASGLLENVTVETIEMSNADGLTIESSRVENDIAGWYAVDVTLRNSAFGGRLLFQENTGNFEIVNNAFEDEVIFTEYLANSYVANNTFEEGLAVHEAGGESTDVVVEDNEFTLGAGDGSGFAWGAIVFMEGNGVVIRRNQIDIEDPVGTNASDPDNIHPRDGFGFDGIVVNGEENVVRENVVSGGVNGIMLGFDLGSGQTVVQSNDVTGAQRGVVLTNSIGGRIIDNRLADNDVGIHVGFGPASAVVANNEIVDNRVGIRVISADAQIEFEGNQVAGNSEFGVQNVAEGDFIFDARENFWGAADGPSSAPANDSDAPFADPVTGTLANGSGDAVSEGETQSVSSVRFDPFLTAPSNETVDRERYYQVDFVTGSRPIATFGPPDSDRFYSDQGRLIRFLHGSTSTPVERVGTPPTLPADVSSCITVESFEVSGDTATVRYTVADGCRMDESVMLVSYEKPGPVWSRATASEQRLVDLGRRAAYNPGTYELRVLLPTNTAAATDTEEQPAIRFRSPR